MISGTSYPIFTLKMELLQVFFVASYQKYFVLRDFRKINYSVQAKLTRHFMTVLKLSGEVPPS